MGPECGCGCGEYLPEGSTRQFKRGHKSRAGNIASAADGEFDDVPVFGLDDAAESAENDPPPVEAAEGERPRAETPIRITKAVRKDVEGKVAWMLAMSGSLWSVQDPFCGGALLEHTDNIAAKLTPILCQSPDVVRWFRRTSGVALYVDLLIAFSPVLQAIYAHHLAKAPREPFPADAQEPVYAA